MLRVQTLRLPSYDKVPTERQQLGLVTLGLKSYFCSLEAPVFCWLRGC